MEDNNNKREIVRAVKFVLISVSAGIVEIAVFALLNEFTGLKYWPCYLTALIASVLWNFTINRRYTFKSAKNVPRAMAMVFAFYLVFTPATTILGNYLAETLHWNEYLVTGINMALNLTLEYLYDTFVVYRGDMDNNDIAEKEKQKQKEKARKEA
ncbi:MAG: GtrA family protein [Clostridiales bacterium]|jgi:putative flippase GtrA|nr:GtrA family protein [Clostridiales bacterium]